MGEDLFWAIRGGGPASFGIVVEWKVRLVPLPTTVAVFDVRRNREDDATKKLVHRWQRRADKVDEDLTFYMIFLIAVSSNSDHKDEGKNPAKIVIQANIRGTFHGGVEKLLELMGEEFPELGLQRQECFEMKWAESFHFANLLRNEESLDVLLINFLSFKMKSDFVKKPIPDIVFKTCWRCCTKKT
ncbi:hypothetical protein TIFTF001_053997 [Ficus carica]|uniref:Uncharacterized protein n=1 Tax=Ficus carica TaxID=3494 RepID=A0AA88EAA4_FICCA|nr:hypothetical protein TIFTF001_053997 [Ficus carica]